MRKRIVEVVIGELIGRGNVDAVEPWLRDDFVDHGPGIVAASKSEWLAKARALPLTGFKIEIHSLYEAGEDVTMLSRRWVPALEGWIAVVDIFRFKDGAIAEHAEVFQPTAAPDGVSRLGKLVPW